MNEIVQRINRWKNCPPWRTPYSTEELIRWLGKGIEIPRQGWNAQTFAEHGRALIVLQHRLGRLTVKKAVPHVALAVEHILNAQVGMIVSRVQGRRSQQEELWLRAIQEVFAEHGLDLAMQVVPPVQSVMHQGYSKISETLGSKPNSQTNGRIEHQSRIIAQKITGLNETTKEQIRNIIQDSMSTGNTVTETAKELESRMPQLNANRAMTIARTELSNAWSEGAASAFLESPSLTHVSVIGCEAEEPNSPQFRGVSTCNIRNVPKNEIPMLLKIGWHPNHQGCLVASGFRNA